MAMGTKHISQQDHPQPVDKYQTFTLQATLDFQFGYTKMVGACEPLQAPDGY